MKIKLEHERLRTLYSILAGIPFERLDLESFYSGTEKVADLLMAEHKCGTTACAAGWAAIYPEFVEQGLSSKAYCNTVIFEDLDWGGRYYDFSAMARFFGLSYDESIAIFGIKDEESWFSKGIEPHQCTDRRVALHRIRRFLRREKVITKSRSQELALQEAAQQEVDVLQRAAFREVNCAASCGSTK